MRVGVLFAVLTISAALQRGVAAALPSHLEPDDAKPAPTGTVDLDLAPEERWSQVVAEVIARHGFEHSFAPLLGIINHVEPVVPELLDVLQAVTAERFPTYYGEMIGVVKALWRLGYGPERGVTLRTFVGLNWLSELQHVNVTSPWLLEQNPLACTSLIARRLDGTILHARNDDANAHHYTTNLTVDVSFTRHAGAEIVAMSTQFVGWIGVYTALRPGVASITEDHRLSPKFTKAAWTDVVLSNAGLGPTHFMMRQAMIDGGGGVHNASFGPTNRSSYEAILSYLEAVPVGEPAYMVLAGVKSSANDQGAVVARNFTSHRTLRLGQTTAWVPFDWALIQTNYEFWEPLPYPAADPRRDVLVSAFASKGQQATSTVDALLAMLSMPSNQTNVNGVLNIGTVFSVIAVPANNTFQAYLRNSHGCCG